MCLRVLRTSTGEETVAAHYDMINQQILKSSRLAFQRWHLSTYPISTMSTGETAVRNGMPMEKELVIGSWNVMIMESLWIQRLLVCSILSFYNQLSYENLMMSDPNMEVKASLCVRVTSARRNRHTLSTTLLTNLNNIFILQHVIFSDALRLMLHRSAPHKCMRKFLNKLSVQSVAEFFHCGVAFCMHNDRLFVVGHLSFGLCVDSDLGKNGNGKARTNVQHHEKTESMNCDRGMTHVVHLPCYIYPKPLPAILPCSTYAGSIWAHNWVRHPKYPTPQSSRNQFCWRRTRRECTPDCPQ